MTVAYATPDQLQAYLKAAVPADVDRLLARASELIDDTVRAAFTVDEDTQLPTEDCVSTALVDAVCAQVEFWGEVGEEHDVEGLAGAGVAIGNLRLDRLPPDLAPRARRILRTAGLLEAVTV